MIVRYILIACLYVCSSTFLFAQDDPCLNWSKFPQQDADKAEMAHVVYRDAVKAKDYDAAYKLWEEAYTLAPAADGKRPFHYMDGRTIFLDKYSKEADDANKNEYAKMIARLYDEQRKCYGGADKENALYSSQVYDMFYTMKRPYPEIYPIAKSAVEKGGDKTDFRVLTPMGYLIQYMFSNKLVDQEEARMMVEKIRAIAKNNEDSDAGPSYKQGIEGADKVIASIEKNIFDCNYFINKLKPAYDADPDNQEVYQDVYTQLVKSGCSKSEPLLMEIQVKIDKANEEARVLNNPLYAGNKLYDAGDIDGALLKYEEAANEQSSADSKATIYYRMAQVYRSDKNQFSKARNYARKAASARPGWGKPYILIGDMYASSSRTCSKDAFKQRLAVLAALNQYAQAKNDPSSAGTAQSRINKYSSSLPTKEMLFERGFKVGEKQSTGCWIGETVTLRANG